MSRSNPSVYLAGPISGLTYSESEGWRTRVRRELEEDGIQCFSPLRGKEFLSSEGALEGSYENHALSTAKGILTQDHDDCRKADLILANMLESPPGVTSVGTVLEIGWAHAYRVPLIMVDTPGSPYNHPMVNEIVGWRVATLDEAVSIARAILMPSAHTTRRPRSSL